MILIDRPIHWHRGRRWCHMVSDRSLEELHAFACRLGIPEKAFQDNPRRNHPHYDLPDELRDQALAMGAVEVAGTDLARRMYRYPDRPSPLDAPTSRRSRALSSSDSSQEK